MICNQLQIWSGFLRVHDNRLHDGNIPKEAGGKFDWELVRADLSGAAFGKNAFVYGHIDDNGKFVRKWPARKKAITDKMGKNGRLSVSFKPFWTQFYGQMLQKEASVRKSSS